MKKLKCDGKGKVKVIQEVLEAENITGQIMQEEAEAKPSRVRAPRKKREDSIKPATGVRTSVQRPALSATTSAGATTSAQNAAPGQVKTMSVPTTELLTEDAKMKSPDFTPETLFAGLGFVDRHGMISA